MNAGSQPDPLAAPQPMSRAHVLRTAATRSPLWLPVEGASMLPRLAGGSRVLISPGRRLRRGAVYAFYDRNGTLFVHRYVGRRRGGCLFHGDARPRSRVERADPEWVVGRAAVVETATGSYPVGSRRWEAWRQWAWLIRRWLMARGRDSVEPPT